jgi:hypothetical protein
MMMIDGVRSVNGRDAASARLAIRRALAKRPAVAIDADLVLKSGGLSGIAVVKVGSRSERAERTPLLVCAVLREDGAVTHIPTGENAGKSLFARSLARQTTYALIELDGQPSATRRFPFAIEPSWSREDSRLGMFVQDKRTVAVLQATDVSWRSNTTAAPSVTSPAKATRAAH